MKIVRSTKSLVALGLVMAVGCTQQNAHESWKKVPAGQSAKAMGVVVDGASVADMEQVERAGGTVREIYGAAGVYEVHGLDLATIKNAVSGAKVYNNKFIPLEDPPLPSHQQQQVPYCDELANPPELQIVTNPESIGGAFMMPVTVKRDGRQVQVSLAGTDLATTKYKMGLLLAPEASALSMYNRPDGPLVSLQAPLTFTPDEMGQYGIVVIAELANTAETPSCALVTSFGVTDDAPYLGSSDPLQIPTAQLLTDFPHLKAVGADQAWAQTKGDGVVIAVVDTGVDYNHPALKANIQINKNEIPDNKIDDDKNGFVDDVVGWDFVNNDAAPFDDVMHGTHVSGLIASTVGIAPNAKILPVKAMGIFGGDAATIVGGVKYAVDSGAKIVNMSLGTYAPNEAIASVVDYADKHGVLLVVAAGNDGISIEVRPMFPAAYANTNLLVVAATDLAGNITDYSNFGAVSVDIAAPGGTDAEGIRSTFYSNAKNELWDKAAGTSFASPIVAGVAALALSKQPQLTPAQLKQLILDKGDARADYKDRILSMKFLDAKGIGATAP